MSFKVLLELAAPGYAYVLRWLLFIRNGWESVVLWMPRNIVGFGASGFQQKQTVRGGACTRRTGGTVVAGVLPPINWPSVRALWRALLSAYAFFFTSLLCYVSLVYAWFLLPYECTLRDYTYQKLDIAVPTRQNISSRYAILSVKSILYSTRQQKKKELHSK